MDYYKPRVYDPQKHEQTLQQKEKEQQAKEVLPCL
jgi:hypothetical protein